jgi:hypothetical protein
MKKLLLFILFILFTTISYSQKYTFIQSVEIGDNFFTTDPLGNIYIYNSGDIFKINQENTPQGRFSSREYGNVGFVDASNPLKILAVFPDFSKAVFLDATLSANSIIDLQFPGIPFVSLICSSKENGFWIFDPQEKRLRKFNDQLTVTIEGTPLRQITDQQVEPVYMVDGGNWIILNAPSYGIIVFDRFGTYYKTIAPGTTQQVQVREDQVIYQVDDHIVLTDLKTGAIKNITLPETAAVSSCRVEGNLVFVKSGGLLNIYSY